MLCKVWRANPQRASHYFVNLINFGVHAQQAALASTVLSRTVSSPLMATPGRSSGNLTLPKALQRHQTDFNSAGTL